MRFALIIFILQYIGFTANAQSYSNQANALNLSALVNNNFWGSGISFYDYDRDGWDDLTIGQDFNIKFYKNNQNGFTVDNSMGMTFNDNVKHPVWVDYDNDGDSDLIVTHYEQPIKVYKNNGNGTFTNVSVDTGIAQTNVRHYGCSWGDYDRDGDLDLYTCTYVFLLENGWNEYDWYNHLYRNNDDGTFSDVTVQAGVGDSLKLSFQGLWIDYDKDLWPDLYVINDKSNPNSLFHNNGDGTFTEVGDITNSSITPTDAMTASGGDFNNDGYEDLFVTNTTNGPTSLLKNNAGVNFTDIGPAAGLPTDKFTWAANWFDYDNDTDLDLYVSEYFGLQPDQQNFFFNNLGNETFANNSFAGDTKNSYVNSVGDYNNDGYTDIAVTNYASQNMDFWVNSGGENNWVKVSLEGVISNRDGIGTWIEVWSQGIKQTRYTYCGENYIGQNSQREIFGIGQAEQVDSVILTWTSGLADKYFNLPSSSTNHFIEGAGISNSILFSGSTNLCSGQSILLDAGVYESYLWNNNLSSQQIEVTAPGEYYVTVTDSFGFTSTSPSVWITAAEPPVVQVQFQHVSCHGVTDGSIDLIIDPDLVESITWSSGEGEAAIDSLEAGLYSYTLVDTNFCATAGDILITQPDQIYTQFETVDPNCFNGSDGSIALTETNAIGYSIEWSNEQQGDVINDLEAGDYYFDLLNGDNCVQSGIVSLSNPAEILIEYSTTDVLCNGDSTGTILATAFGGTGNLEIDFSGQNPVALPAGEYEIVVTDEANCLVQLTYEISEPEALTIDFVYDYPTYTLIVNGGVAPYAILWDTNDTTITLTDADCSTLHAVSVMDANLCTNGIEVFCIGTSDHKKDQFISYPNPVIDQLTITGIPTKKFVLKIMDVFGKSVFENSFQQMPKTIQLDVSFLQSGCYFMTLTGPDYRHSTCFVKQ